MQEDVQSASQPENTDPTPQPTQPIVGPQQSRRKRLLLIGLVIMLIFMAGAAAYWFGRRSLTSQPAAATSSTTETTTDTSTQQSATLPGLQLDTKKDYGNKYADGLLPVGDGKYTTTGAKQGSVYVCSSYAQNLAQGGGGASVRGPWFTNNNTEYNINQKAHVNGSVAWQGSFANVIANGTRTITTNDLPSHITGIFPIAVTDPAYTYDRNPNSIKSQILSYALNANSVYGSPTCMGGQAGIMLTGVALFNAFDAGGRDAGAWEVQDSCSGHPEKTGEYHYHTLSSCIKDTSVQTVIGFALDGFPITGPKVGPNSILTTSDLDECHGITSSILLDGKQTIMYHYVMTQDFPYSVSCFRGTAIQPPGLQSQATGPHP